MPEMHMDIRCSSRAPREIIPLRCSPVRFITDYCLDTSNIVNFTRNYSATCGNAAFTAFSFGRRYRDAAKLRQAASFICKQFRPLGSSFSLRATLLAYRVTCASHDSGRALAGLGKRSLCFSYEEERRALPCLTRSLPRTKERKRRVAAW